MRALLAATALSAPGFAWAGQPALPQGGNFAAGGGTIQRTANSVTVTQTTPRGVVNWQSFNVGQGGLVNFQNGGGATLSRVLGRDASSILGDLRATGSLYLINPNGIVIGASGKVVVGGDFIAATHNIADQDFMSGRSLVFKSGSTASIVNLGTISALGGDAILIARQVVNGGTIAAPQGTAVLAGGSEVELREAGAAGDRVHVRLVGDGSVDNEGMIKAAEVQLQAAGGNIYALAGNNGGMIEATGTTTRNGRVVLTGGGDIADGGSIAARNADGSGGEVTVASADHALAVSGSIDVRGTGGGTNGGSAVLTGKTVTLASTASIDASGDANGGSIRAGGGFHGADAAIANAVRTVLAASATLKADSTRNGNGGTVAVWSDEATSFAGSISAQGGAQGGDGGFVEVSGKETLAYDGVTNTLAPAGKSGTLLLDPANLQIQAAYGAGQDDPAGTNGGHNQGSYPGWPGQLLSTQGAGGATAYLSPAAIAAALATSDVVLQATNDVGIHFSGTGISSTSGNSLAIEAGHDITVGSDFHTISVTGGLYLFAGVTGFTNAFTAHAIATPTFGATGTVTLIGGTSYSAGALGITVGSATNAIVSGTNPTLTASGPIDFSRSPGLTLSGNATFNSASGNGAITLPALSGGGNNLTLSSGSGTITLNAVTASTLTMTSTGTVNGNGALAVTNLALLGTGGSYNLTNTGNAIGTVAANTGSVNLVDNSNLTIGTAGVTTGVTASGDISLRALGSNSLTIAGIAQVTATAGGNDIILQGGTFINNRGSDAVVQAGRRLRVYATSPTTSQTNGLAAGATTVYSQTYPYSLASWAAGGRFFVYSVADPNPTNNNTTANNNTVMQTLTAFDPITNPGTTTDTIQTNSDALETLRQLRASIDRSPLSDADKQRAIAALQDPSTSSSDEVLADILASQAVSAATGTLTDLIDEYMSPAAASDIKQKVAQKETESGTGDLAKNETLPKEEPPPPPTEKLAKDEPPQPAVTEAPPKDETLVKDESSLKTETKLAEDVKDVENVEKTEAKDVPVVGTALNVASLTLDTKDMIVDPSTEGAFAIMEDVMAFTPEGAVVVAAIQVANQVSPDFAQSRTDMITDVSKGKVVDFAKDYGTGIADLYRDTAKTIVNSDYAKSRKQSLDDLSSGNLWAANKDILKGNFELDKKVVTSIANAVSDVVSSIGDTISCAFSDCSPPPPPPTPADIANKYTGVWTILNTDETGDQMMADLKALQAKDHIPQGDLNIVTANLYKSIAQVRMQGVRPNPGADVVDMEFSPQVAAKANAEIDAVLAEDKPMDQIKKDLDNLTKQNPSDPYNVVIAAELSKRPTSLIEGVADARRAAGKSEWPPDIAPVGPALTQMIQDRINAIVKNDSGPQALTDIAALKRKAGDFGFLVDQVLTDTYGTATGTYAATDLHTYQGRQPPYPDWYTPLDPANANLYYQIDQAKKAQGEKPVFQSAIEENHNYGLKVEGTLSGGIRIVQQTTTQAQQDALKAVQSVKDQIAQRQAAIAAAVAQAKAAAAAQAKADADAKAAQAAAAAQAKAAKSAAAAKPAAAGSTVAAKASVAAPAKSAPPSVKSVLPQHFGGLF